MYELAVMMIVLLGIAPIQALAQSAAPPSPHNAKDAKKGPTLTDADRAMLDLMTAEERTAALTQVRESWLATLSAERRVQYDQRVAEAAQMQALTTAQWQTYLEQRRREWLSALTPEQQAQREAQRLELETVKQLTPEEQRAYFESHRRRARPDEP